MFLIYRMYGAKWVLLANDYPTEAVALRIADRLSALTGRAVKVVPTT